MTKRVTPKYRQTLEGYLRWTGSETNVLFRPTFELDPMGPTAADAMRDWESHGTPLPVGCAEPVLLARYVQGKVSRDWHISEWRLGVRDELFFPSEFVGTFGLTVPEVEHLFGVSVQG